MKNPAPTNNNRERDRALSFSFIQIGLSLFQLLSALDVDARPLRSRRPCLLLDFLDELDAAIAVFEPQESRRELQATTDAIDEASRRFQRLCRRLLVDSRCFVSSWILFFVPLSSDPEGSSTSRDDLGTAEGPERGK